MFTSSVLVARERDRHCETRSRVSHSVQGPVSRKSREIFGPEKPVVKLQSARFEKLTFLHVFNIRRTKRIATFDGLEARRCEDIKGIVAPEIDPKSFGTFEKRAPDLRRYYDYLPHE